jgi:hypothetical protein
VVDGFDLRGPIYILKRLIPYHLNRLPVSKRTAYWATSPLPPNRAGLDTTWTGKTPLSIMLSECYHRCTRSSTIPGVSSGATRPAPTVVGVHDSSGRDMAMDPLRFDGLARRLALNFNRRQVLKTFIGGAVGLGMTGATTPRMQAQECETDADCNGGFCFSGICDICEADCPCPPGGCGPGYVCDTFCQPCLDGCQCETDTDCYQGSTPLVCLNGACAQTPTASLTIHTVTCPVDTADLFGECHGNALGNMPVSVGQIPSVVTDANGQATVPLAAGSVPILEVGDLTPYEGVYAYCSDQTTGTVLFEGMADGGFLLTVTDGAQVVCDFYNLTPASAGEPQAPTEPPPSAEPPTTEGTSSEGASSVMGTSSGSQVTSLPSTGATSSPERPDDRRWSLPGAGAAVSATVGAWVRWRGVIQKDADRPQD